MSIKRFIPVLVAIMAIAIIIPSSVIADEINKDPQGSQVSSDTGNPTENEQGEPSSDDSEKRDCWTKISGSKAYRYADGTYATGFTKIDGKTYYFDSNFLMVTGWKKIDGKKHYFKSNGNMAIGLTKISKNKYYFDKNGRMQTGFKTISGKKHYFQKNGKMVANGKRTIGKNLCYFNSKGVLIRTIDKTKPMVALTYDDGPSKSTRSILNTLKKYDGVATFFVVGNRVSAFSSTIKRASKMGCEIGNHTYSHKILTGTSIGTIRSQISKTNKAIKRQTGSPAEVMRPPGGAHNSTVRRNVGAPLILWSIDTLDWKTRNSSKTISAVLNHVKDGDIVLMHDLYEPTAKASKTIIPKLVKRGYQLVTVSELADCRGPIKNGKVYYKLRK